MILSPTMCHFGSLFPIADIWQSFHTYSLWSCWRRLNRLCILAGIWQTKWCYCHGYSARLAFGLPSFIDRSHRGMSLSVHFILSKKVTLPPSLPTFFLQECWQPRPSKRPTIDSVSFWFSWIHRSAKLGNDLHLQIYFHRFFDNLSSSKRRSVEICNRPTRRIIKRKVAAIYNKGSSSEGELPGRIFKLVQWIGQMTEAEELFFWDHSSPEDSARSFNLFW